MRIIDRDLCEMYLRRIGLQIGSWNQVQPIQVDGSNAVSEYWTKYTAPRDARELYNFSQYVSGWLPTGNWKILQFDFSNEFECSQADWIRRQFNLNLEFDSTLSRTLLCEFGEEKKSRARENTLVSDFVFMMLLWEGHCQIVSSASIRPEYISIQDGCLYFCSDKESRVNDNPVSVFEKNRNISPDWILELRE